MSTADAPVSTKPYILRALYDWCVDNGYTPHILVSVGAQTRVPMAYVRDGQIVLNLAPYATHQLVIGNEDLSCQARFGGVAHALFVPMENILAIYARENGQGMVFSADGVAGMVLADSNEDAADEPVVGAPVVSLAAVPEAVPEPASDTPSDDDEPPRPPAGRGHLRVVK